MDARTQAPERAHITAIDPVALMENAKAAETVLKALAHESRLLLLCVLSYGERSVGELENLLQMRQSAVSQQLARLRLDRLVKTRRSGKTIHYSIADDDVRRIVELLCDIYCRPRSPVASGV